MAKFVQSSRHQFDAPLGNLVEDFMLGSKTAEEWALAHEQAATVLQTHKAELQELIIQMQSFSHETSVKTVITVQSRTAALRLLIQSIEHEMQQLDKAYREVAQLEQFRQDQAMMLT